ncbi:hypothetical protein ETAA8_64810 [Anatilimnocola aggregata]|uniref:DUF1501 domain-containing protein n=1 Tax=Anatilimnocola aggregata TaxID=2528021 RepID=A0A517YM72_9BACT|nr:DUF1501 domain-containing protein [Anatilimnocola aggregata]QDU31328.1 hypothetical protein ETAA8_64810 [Anatilimnocola aggregata]
MSRHQRMSMVLQVRDKAYAPMAKDSASSVRYRLAGRRGFLQVSTLAAGSLAAASVLPTALSEAATKRRAPKSAILFFLAGGPSHIDTYDMKPEQTAEIRGPFQACETSLPGLLLPEIMPAHHGLAKELAVVRSVTHHLSVHDDATHWLQTGYPLLNARARGQSHPAMGAVVSKLQGPRQEGMPAYVCVPEDYRTHMGFYLGASYLRSRHQALNSGGDPSLGNYRPPEFMLPKEISLPRLEDRQNLLRSLDRLAAQRDANVGYQDADDALTQAVELAGGPQARRAFDLEQEQPKTRDRYGRHAYGQGALLARRLIEAGSSLVVINLYEKDVDWWDDHTTIEKNLRARLPRYDQAFCALVSDLAERGLLDNTLVASFGEFGRSPRIDKGAGRGHWPAAMSAVLTGGGVKSGQIIGSTVADGSEPKDRPLSPGDLLASIYQVLGVDPQQSLTDSQGRPIPLLSSGLPIRELFA